MGILLLISLPFLSGVDAPTFTPPTFTLEAGGSVGDIAVCDLNRDNRNDILVLCYDATSGSLDKHLAVFLADADGFYDSRPSFTLALDPGSGSVFLAEADGEPPAELVATHAEGAAVFAFRDTGFVPFATYQFPTLLPGGVRKPIFLEDAAVDLDGDGIDEWLVPARAGYAVRNPAGLMCHVDCGVVSTIKSGSSVSISHWFPEYHTFDLLGQKQKGLVFLNDRWADFAYGPNWAEHQRFNFSVEGDHEWAVKVQMRDIDGNGLPDLIIHETRGNLRLIVRTRIYLGSVPFTFSQVPTATFEVEGALTSPLLADVNGDNKLDVVNIKVPFGPRLFINYFLRRKLSLQAMVYLQSEGGFSPLPDSVTNISIDAPEDRQRVTYTMGDFNGDGHIDVALGAGAEKLVIHAGEETRFVSSKPWLTLPLPTYGEARCYDLNRNDNDDVVIFHPEGEHDDRVEVVVF